MMGPIYGDYGGRSDEFAPGGFSFENSFCPHGGKLFLVVVCVLAYAIPVSYDEFKKATEMELTPVRVHEGTMGELAPIQ